MQVSIYNTDSEKQNVLVNCHKTVAFNLALLFRWLFAKDDRSNRITDLESISPTFYEQPLQAQIQKAQKDTEFDWIFTLSGSAHIKAARR